jgi:flagellar hook assembly protein FlgD
LLNNVLQSNGFHSVVWNGKDSSNLIVPAGIYTVKIYVVDKAGNKALTYPIIKTVTVI